MKTRDYIARITVYGLPTMSKKELARFAKWLERQARNLKSEAKEYSSNFSAKLMK